LGAWARGEKAWLRMRRQWAWVKLSATGGWLVRAYFSLRDREEGKITYYIASHCTGESVIELWVLLERLTALRVGVDVYDAASIFSEWGNWKVVGRSLVIIQG
jgi:hypothetical protein